MTYEMSLGQRLKIDFRHKDFINVFDILITFIYKLDIFTGAKIRNFKINEKKQSYT